MTPKITDLMRRRLEQVEAQWNASGQLDEGQISFLFRLAAASFSAKDEAYELKLAAAGGEDVPGSANCVAAADVTRWREEGVKRERAQDARFARLRIAFHDAIRRPLGVTPDSGAEFYEPRMADEAEERRRLARVGGRHAYQPHKLYPHFCGQCGYPEREALMHLPAASTGSDQKGGSSAA